MITNEFKMRMPGEFEPHDGCIMIWPTRPGSWIYDGRDAKRTFSEIADAIAKDEHLYMLTDEEHYQEVVTKLSEKKHFSNMTVMIVDSDDSWARDVGPTFVLDSPTTR